jgi:hypothetical protein
MKSDKELKDYLFDKYDVKDNPKREKCYRLAYEYGHSFGDSEIESTFSDFVELIK